MSKYKAVKETIRNYYKYTTPNLTLVGNPTISGPIIRDFSTSNYATLPSQFYSASVGKTWEIVIAFETSNNTTYQTIFASGFPSGSASYNGFIVYTYTDGKVYLQGETSATATYRTAGFSIDVNTKYYFKYAYIGNSYTFGYSTDGKNFTTIDTRTTIYWNSTDSVTRLGISLGSDGTLITPGTYLKMYLPESYITIDGGIWWRGMDCIKSTESDYDFYEDVEQYKAVKETVRKYYKYVDEAWTNPIMTAQINPGGDDFAAFMDSTYSTRYAYHMFDGQTGTGYTAQTQGTLPHHLGFYNPDPVRITNLTFNWVVASSVYYSPRNGQLEASNDGTNWVTLQTFSYPSANPATISFTNPSNNYYKYYRLYGTDGGKSTIYACTECTVSGYSRTGIIETTEQDYDFYEDTDIYKAILV